MPFQLTHDSVSLAMVLVCPCTSYRFSWRWSDRRRYCCFVVNRICKPPAFIYSNPCALPTLENLTIEKEIEVDSLKRCWWTGCCKIGYSYSSTCAELLDTAL